VRAARPRRGRLVALSGIDGAGKSSQARWLAQALTALGAPAEVVWNDLLGNVALDVVAKPIKAVRQSRRGEVTPMSSYADREPPADAGTSRVRALWSSYVTLSNSLEQRIRALPARARGRVVVFDRGPLDLAVRMEVLYRSRVERQRRLVALAAPRPDLAFLLDLDPGLSLGRKQDIWSPRQLREQAATYRALAPRFGARVLDASRPPELLAAEIARAVWLSG
jgi:thymidylate kinase